MKYEEIQKKPFTLLHKNILQIHKVVDGKSGVSSSARRKIAKELNEAIYIIALLEEKQKGQVWITKKELKK